MSVTREREQGGRGWTNICRGRWIPRWLISAIVRQLSVQARTICELHTKVRITKKSSHPGVWRMTKRVYSRSREHIKEKICSEEGAVSGTCQTSATREE